MMANSKDNLFVLTTLNFKEEKSYPETKPLQVTDCVNKYDPIIFCRTCANADPCLVPIFKEEGLDYSLNKKIEKYLPIQVSEKDDLPLHLCYHCASTLIAWDALVIGCVEAEKKLILMKKDSIENNKDEQVSKNSEAVQKNIDSDDEPLITKKNISGLKKNEEKRDILQEKNDLQALEPVEIETGRLMEEPDLSFSTYQHAFTMSRPFIFEIFSLRIANPFCCELCSAVVNLKFAFVRSLREGKKKVNIKYTESKSSDDNSVITRKELKRRKRFKSDCHVVCGSCGKVLSCELSLKNHMKTHRNEKTLTCGSCGKVFKHRFNLLRHIRVIHEGLRNHVCSDCGKRFRSRGEMEDHRNIHSLERKIVCEECGRIFLTKAAFYPHKKSHRFKGREKKCGAFDCGECHKKFTTKKSRNQHMLIHAGEKPIACRVCGKNFRTKANLSQHAKTHSDVKPFSCERCGKAFARKDHLRIHVRCHTGEKPFVCNYCGKGFAQINDKKKHSRTHEKKLSAD